MKKLTAFFALLLLNGCYYSVPAQQVYYEDTYATTYDAPMAYDSSVYVVQEQPATYYQSQTSFVYINDGPDVLYYDSPFVAPRPHYYRHAPAPMMHHSHHASRHHARHSTPTHRSAKSHHVPLKHGGKPEKLPGKGAPRHGGRK